MSRIVGLIFKGTTPATDKYPCPHCGKEFRSEKALDKHLTEAHPESGPDGG